MSAEIEADTDSQGRQFATWLLRHAGLGSLRYTRTTRSTNSDAIEELRIETLRGDLPRLHLTDHQASGRGRHGRRWQSGTGTLTFSLMVAWPMSDSLATHLLPLASGVALAEAIEQRVTPRRCQLKWPNDLYAADGKLAGILIESVAGRPVAVIGVGLNVGPLGERLSTPPGPRVASLEEWTGRPWDRFEVLAALIPRLIDGVGQLREAPESVLKRYRQRCCLTGRKVRFERGAAVAEGDCVGIADDGALRVILRDGEEIRLQSGQVDRVRL